MATKIRLQRHGRKKRAFFHIVVADSRSPRDGKFIEKLGSYNPITNPATIVLNVDRAAQWLIDGAQPTDTVAAILSYKGASMKKHLQVGVNKGAITQEEADKRFETWTSEKGNKVQGKKDRLAKEKSDNLSKMMKHEREVNENRLKAITAAAEAASASAKQAEAATEAGAAPLQGAGRWDARGNPADNRDQAACMAATSAAKSSLSTSMPSPRLKRTKRRTWMFSPTLPATCFTISSTVTPLSLM
jgi:small subunit ribosomal protein S16